MSAAAQDTRHDFAIRRLSPTLGAEVARSRHSRSPSIPDTLQVIRDAFQEHHLLCFRDQRLD